MSSIKDDTGQGIQNRTYGRSIGSILAHGCCPRSDAGGVGGAGQLGGELPRRVKPVAVSHRREGDDGGRAVPAAPVQSGFGSQLMQS